MTSGRALSWMAGASLMALATPAWAGDGDGDDETPSVEAEEEALGDGDGDGDVDAATVELKGSLQDQANRVFTKDDLARFAPRTALDMVRNIPGFTISGSDSSERGLGQASQNILLNGQRVSAKSNDAATTLSRIDADDVIRIEIVDGATLDIPGLSGEVANILYRTSSMGGTYEWNPIFRERVGHSIINGELSLNGRSGSLQWNASVTAERLFQGHWGPEFVYSPTGEELLRRDEYGRYPQNRSGIAASISREADNGNILNANASFKLQRFSHRVEGEVYSGDVFIGDELSAGSNHGWEAEFGGDYEFGVGDGRLKFIGLQRFDHEPRRNTFLSTNNDFNEFAQDVDSRESVVRSEYRWGGTADWQVSLEGALNTLDSEASLYFIPGGGSRIDIPVPGANATVQEKRAEAILSYGRPIADGLTLQLNAGGEFSRISVEGDAGNGERSYWRPKGSVSLAWRASPTLAVNAEVERKVDQLSFGSLLATVDVSNNTDRATNIELVPSQRWRGQIEVTKTFPGVATITPFVNVAFVEDKVEIVPVSATEEALGNVESSEVYFFGVRGTLELASLGWKGAKIDFNGAYQKTYIEDPLLGVDRDISSVMDHNYSARLRHDIPDTNWAWGANINRFVQTPFYRLDQVSRNYNGGHNASIFIENKDVYGLTVTASVSNLLNSTDEFWRDVYVDRRDGPLAFREERSREYGPIFSFSIKGNI